MEAVAVVVSSPAAARCRGPVAPPPPRRSHQRHAPLRVRRREVTTQTSQSSQTRLSSPSSSSPSPSPSRIAPSSPSSSRDTDDGEGRASHAVALALSLALVLVGGVETSVAAPQPASADAAAAAQNHVRDMYVAAGNYAFLEKEFNDLKYAGVKDVVPGLAGLGDAADTRVQAVKVSYDSDRISHEVLMRTYWKHADPVNTAAGGGGQFREIGTQYRGAVWVDGAGEKSQVETSVARMQASGIFGVGKVFTTPILDAPPVSFEPFPQEARRVLQLHPKSVEKEAKVRDAAFKDLWGYVQFCAQRVCGYVRFAPKCTGTCLDVFPEYRERNFGVPELVGDIKITSK
mmetsp:Transcript_24399/g.39253  ORF Transcript_24399/g.39253 Transcript_24399/m.39253 type:complete len:345 (-) Transcript_24399:119-1153(-)